MTLLDRFVIRPECGLSFLHLRNDERPVDDRLEAADRRAFLQRKGVDGFDWSRLAIHEPLCHHDARAERRNLGINRHTHEWDWRVFLREQTGRTIGGEVLRHRCPLLWRSRENAAGTTQRARSTFLATGGARPGPHSARRLARA